MCLCVFVWREREREGGRGIRKGLENWDQRGERGRERKQETERALCVWREREGERKGGWSE